MAKMKNNKILACLADIIDNSYKNETTSRFEEKSIGMMLPIDASGCSFLSYSFDKHAVGAIPRNIPFFSSQKGVQSMCDYIVFSHNEGKLFILMIELKNSHQQTMPQLIAGKCLAKFIVDTCNRVNSMSLKPEYRLVSVCKSHVVKKGSTKMRDFEYDDKGFHCFEGKIFMLKEFLK